MGTAQAHRVRRRQARRSKPEELAAEVLKSLRADVKEQLGVAPGARGDLGAGAVRAAAERGHLARPRGSPGSSGSS